MNIQLSVTTLYGGPAVYKDNGHVDGWGGELLGCHGKIESLARYALAGDGHSYALSKAVYTDGYMVLRLTVPTPLGLAAVVVNGVSAIHKVGTPAVWSCGETTIYFNEFMDRAMIHSA